MKVRASLNPLKKKFHLYDSEREIEDKDFAKFMNEDKIYRAKCGKESFSNFFIINANDFKNMNKNLGIIVICKRCLKRFEGENNV